MPEPMTDLAEMLSCLDVAARPSGYVFVCLPVGSPALAEAEAVIVEDEGVTAVLTEERASGHGLEAGPLFAWLTLTINSSLEAVGLTAAFSAALAAEKISCNVLAGYHHDHLLVPWRDRDRAIETLRRLRSQA